MNHHARRMHQSAQVTYILKVIPCDGTYVCGICRTGYRKAKAAESCLAKCWQRVRHSVLVSPRTISMGRVLFRCLLCSRDYTSESEAHICAEDCVSNYDRRLQSLLNGLGIALAPYTPMQFTKRHLHQPKPYEAKTRLESADEIAASIPVKESPPATRPTTTESDLNGSQVVAKESAAPANAAADADEPASPEKADLSDQKKVKEHKKRHRSDYPKQWLRKNAEYECSVCNSRYFTRNETEQCFSSHFDEQGNYQDKGDKKAA